MYKRALLSLLLFLLLLPVSAARKSSPGIFKRTATQQFSNLNEQDRKLFDYYFQQAVNLKLQEKYAESFEYYRYCTLLDSLDPQPWYELSTYYRSLNDTVQALNTMEKAFRLNNTNEWYAFGLANMYLSMNRVPDATKLYEHLVLLRPDDENLQYQLAELYTKANDFKSAVKTFNLVERLIGKNESVSYEKYRIFKQSGQFKKAIREIQSLQGEFPYDVDYVLLLGDAWMDIGKPKKAWSIYQQAQTMDPGNPSISLSLADYYNQLGDSIAANNQLNLVLTNPNTDVETILSIFTPILSSSMASGDSVRIRSYFNLLLERHPNEYQIRDLYVQWLLETGNKQEAKDELRTVLDLNPNELKAWKNYLQLNLEYNNQDAIRNICHEALTYFPKEAIFWFYLGLSWTSETEDGKVDQSKSQKSLEAFQKAIEVANPNDKEFVSRLYGIIGDTYFVLKDTVSAFTYYEKALDEFAGNLLVLNNYAYYLAVKGRDLPKAEKMSRKTVEADPKNATYLDTFAWIFFKEGQYSLARIYIERAVANDSELNAEVLEHYGDILWFNNEKDAAREQWKKAAKMGDPSVNLLKKVESGTYDSTNANSNN